MISRTYLYNLFFIIGIPMLIIGLTLFAAIILNAKSRNRKLMANSKSTQSLKELSEMHQRNSAAMEGFKVKIHAEMSDIIVYERKIWVMGKDTPKGSIDSDSNQYSPVRSSDELKLSEYKKVLNLKKNRIKQFESLIKKYKYEQKSIQKYAKSHRKRLATIIRDQKIANEPGSSDTLKRDLDTIDAERRVLYDRYDIAFANVRQYKSRITQLELDMDFRNHKDENEYNRVVNQRTLFREQVRVGNERMSSLFNDIMDKTNIRRSIIEQIYKL